MLCEIIGEDHLRNLLAGGIIILYFLGVVKIFKVFTIDSKYYQQQSFRSTQNV